MSETSSEIAVLHAVLAAAEARTTAAERALTQSHAIILASDDMIRHLHLEIAKLRREQFGPSSERSTRLIEQLEMQIEDPETDIAADRCEAKAEAPRSVVDAFKRRRLSRKPFPEHLPRDPRRGGGTNLLHLLRVGAHREDGRRHQRDAGAPAVEGDPDGP